MSQDAAELVKFLKNCREAAAYIQQRILVRHSNHKARNNTGSDGRATRNS